MSAAPRPVVPVWVTDAALAAIIALLGLSGGLSHDSPLSPAATALIVAMGVALLLRRRLPGTVAAFEAAIVGALALMDVPLKATFLAVLVSGYSAAVYGSRLLARALLVAAIVSVVGLGIPEGFGAGKWLGTNLPVPVIVAAAGAVLVGLVVRTKLETRAEHIAALAERAELLAVGQAENERRATLAERLRIAREMHDIVAHHISVVVIQAQGAQRVVDDDPARAKTAMADVERVSRTALEEMRRLLGLLRTGEPADPQEPEGAYVPPLGLADVDGLAERLQGTGLGISVVRRGEPHGIPDDVGLTVYRVVQESLTNVLKHAGPAMVTVELEFADQIEVIVTDDGQGASAALSAVPGTGRGTAGMRERVAAAGGDLRAGPRPGGGYRVHATIPLGESS
ncbi:MAG TPA: sensor histidine kinase [Streptosporangiaceae bacterium]|nr:sensor histidine kinase [Streptosporangiaceae bacterium]